MVGDGWAPVGDGPVRRACAPHPNVLRCARRLGAIAVVGCVLRTSSQLALMRWRDCFADQALVLCLFVANICSPIC